MGVKKPVRILQDKELIQDGELIFFIAIPSNPATKKNSNRIVKIKGFIKILPSERFLKYQSFCKDYLKDIIPDIPYDFGVSIKIRVATDKWILPDYTNVCQALGDILQHYEIISDDKWIHWTDGDYNNNIPKEHWFIGVDKENPRIEIEMRRFRHPLENYRFDKEQAEEKKRKKK
jgi:Holliday junction resolvase RusA-like endonuclease